MAAALVDLLKTAQALLFPPAHGGALAALLQRSRSALGQVPPDDHMSFLRQSDGAIVDGLMLYGSQAHQLDAALLPELVEINLQRRLYRDDLADILLLGEKDDDFIAYDRGTAAFYRIDRSSGDRSDRAVRLQEMIARLLR